MKKIKKVIFWIITILVVMFIGVWSVGTASYIHLGKNFPDAIVSGFSDAADGVGEIFGINSKIKPDIVLNFKNGNISFDNTHISW